jgi:integrase
VAHKEGVIRIHLIPQLGRKRIDGIGNEDVQRLKYHLRGHAQKSVNNVLTVLNTMLKKAVEWKVIDRMPCVIRLLKVSEGSVGFYDIGEYDQLRSAAEKVGPQALLVVLLGGDAGLRSGEMRALRWTDVNLVKRQLCVERGDWRGHVSTTKGGRLRYVPLTTRLATALQRHRHLKGGLVLAQPDGKPLTANMIVSLVQRAAKRANLRNNGPHILRHTFCSHLAMRGARARAIQELVGHRDLLTTQRYMHLSPAAVEAAIRLLELPDPGAASGNIVATGDLLIENVSG